MKTPIRNSCQFLIISSLLAGIFVFPADISGQSALKQLEDAAGQSVNVPAVSGPVPVGPYSSSSGSSGSSGLPVNPNTAISNAVAGALMQSLLNNIFSPTPQKSQAELEAERLEQERQAAELERQRLEEEARQQEIHNNLINSSKSIGSESLDFKSLDGELEGLRKAASDQFEPDGGPADKIHISHSPDALGENLKPEEIETLVDPDNDPMIVDLREAKTYIVKNIKEDSLKIKLIKENEAKETKAETKAPCNKPELEKKLNGYMNERAKFLKTIEMTQNELEKWKNQNNEALWNAASTGLEFFVDDLMSKLEKKAEAASRLEQILSKNKEQMIKDGMDVAEISAKIGRLNNLASLSKLKKVYDMKLWSSLIRDEWSALVLKFSESNAEIKALLEEPMMQKYFDLENPSPQLNIPSAELKVLKDIADIGLNYDLFGKWVAKKAPLIAWTQFAIDQIYNATDWYLSYKNICTLNEVSGREAEAARYQQQKIDQTISLIQNCN